MGQLIKAGGEYYVREGRVSNLRVQTAVGIGLLAIFINLTRLHLNYKDDLYFNSLWSELRGMQHKDKVGKCRNADDGLT